MALIKCPECGKEISDRANACIYCGYPIQPIRPNESDTGHSRLRAKPKKRNKKTLIGVIVTLMTILSVIIVLLIVGGIEEPQKSIITTEKTYTVEIDGQIYHANSQEEIDAIINEHIYGGLNKIESNGYIDANKTGKAMIEIETGECLGISGSDYYKFYFKVRNTSDVSVHTIGIDIDILDKNGDILSTTHPQTPSTLQPGQAINIDALAKINDGGVSAVVSGYSLDITNGGHTRGRIENSPQIDFHNAGNDQSPSSHITKELVIGEWTKLKIDGVELQFRYDGLTPIQDKGTFGTFVMMLCAIENVSSSDFDAYYFFENNVKITDAENFLLPASHYGWNYDGYDCDTEISSGEKQRIVKAFDYNGDVSALRVMISDDENDYILMGVKQDTNNSTPKQNDTNYKNTSYSCAECGKHASRTYTNPFSGSIEHYCDTHYQEIIDIMSMMESDVGNSKQSKHTCEQCSREGTHKYNSFTGQTEYYCTQHYEELVDMLEAFGLD